MWPRADPREAIGAQFRDLAQRKIECPDQNSAEVVSLLWRIDCLLDRYLALISRAGSQTREAVEIPPR
jgi:hypothetical protein